MKALCEQQQPVAPMRRACGCSAAACSILHLAIDRLRCCCSVHHALAGHTTFVAAVCCCLHMTVVHAFVWCTFVSNSSAACTAATRHTWTVLASPQRCPLRCVCVAAVAASKQPTEGALDSTAAVAPGAASTPYMFSPPDPFRMQSVIFLVF